MDPLNQFQSKAAANLANWVSQTLALKEAKVHTNDAMAAIGQRAQVQVETSEMPDTFTPPAGESTSRADLVSTGITEERVREIIEEILEDYASKEWVEDKGYATEEWVEDKGYATETWVEDKDYATEEWVEDKDYATEEWVEDQDYLKKSDQDGWDNMLINMGGTAEEHLVEEVVKDVIDDYFDRLNITAECIDDAIVVTFTLE
jgi:hypothetical protein